jgi:prepilin-type N-terminal cleavage/methylation domain-containing protein
VINKKNNLTSSSSGFTLLELIIVVSIATLITVAFTTRFGIFERFQEDRFISEMINTLEFLHDEAKKSYTFYSFSFDLKNRTWRAGQLNGGNSNLPNPNSTQTNPLLAQGVGTLTSELASFLNPPLGNPEQLSPPEGFPSLYEEHRLPGEARFSDIVTPRGMVTEESGYNPYIIFSPRGFTEFAVIHLKKSNGSDLTLLTNPFTGIVELHQGYQEFKWELDTTGGGI